jgi:hypothetical protein
MDMKRQYEPEHEPERQTESYAPGEAESAPGPDMDLALDLCIQQQPSAPPAIPQREPFLGRNE